MKDITRRRYAEGIAGGSGMRGKKLTKRLTGAVTEIYTHSIIGGRESVDAMAPASLLAAWAVC